MPQDRKSLNPLISWLWQILSLYSTEEIKIPSSYQDKVFEVKDILRSDTSGIVNSVLDFGINCATVDYTIESNNEQLTQLITDWFKNINLMLIGRVPTGIKALSKEYYRERWKNSSLIVLRTLWENKDGLNLPTKMWFVDGINIEIENGNDTRVIGEEQYFLKINSSKKDNKLLPTSKNELIFIQKPFDSWSELYSNPFVIQRGLYKNLKLFDLINKKAERIVGKALEYLMLLKKGTENLTLKGLAEYTYSKEDLQSIKTDLKKMISDSKTEAGTPIYTTGFDTEIEHIIPEYARILQREIYTTVEKRLLAGLGLIDIVEGTSSSISKEEFVLVKIDGKINYINIESLEKIFNESKTEKHLLEVPTYNNGKLEWKKATIWSHPFEGFIYRITTDNGRFNVEVTGNHSIMVWGDDGLFLKRANEINKDDYVLSPIIFHQEQKELQEIIYNYSVNQFIHKKEIIKIDEDLAYLLGWYVAEGCAGDRDNYSGITLNMNKSEINYAKQLIKIAKDKFKLRGGNIYYRNDKGKKVYIRNREIISNGLSMNISFGGKYLGSLFLNLCGHLAKNKKIPQAIFNSPRYVQLKFLAGLFLGDGNVDDRFGERYILSTVSRELAFGVVTLLQLLGYHPDISKYRKKGFELPEYKVGFNILEHNQIIKTRFLGIPTKFIHEYLPNDQANNEKVYNNEWYEKYKYNFPSEWLFKKVIKIEKFPYNGKVYDLEVNDNETFVAGCGSILVHNTRRESILNPKPFIKEVENGITDFISLLSDIIKVIIDKNKTGHPKYFSPNVDIQLHYTPIREFISDSIRDHLRSMYDRGVLSKQTYTEVIGGCDIDIERKRRVQETQDDYNTIFYPPLIQNREDIPDITDETIENLPEEKTGPEAKNFKGISLEELITPEIASEYIRLRQRDPDDFEKDSFRIIVLSKTKGIKAIIGRLKGKTTTTVQSYLFEKTKWNETEAKNWVEKHKGEIEESLDLYDEGLIYEEAPYKTVEDLPAQVKVLPKDAQRLWLRVFNQSYPKGEDYARRVAWSVVKRIYKKVGDQWTKKSKTKGEDGKMIDLEKASVDDILTNIVQLQKIELQEAQLKVAKKILEEKEGEK